MPVVEPTFHGGPTGSDIILPSVGWPKGIYLPVKVHYAGLLSCLMEAVFCMLCLYFIAVLDVFHGIVLMFLLVHHIRILKLHFVYDFDISNSLFHKPEDCK